MAERLKGDELVALIKRVFVPRETDKRLALLVDLPDSRSPDHARWAERREMALDWWREIEAKSSELKLRPALVFYRNAHSNNGELPAQCCLLQNGGAVPQHADELDASRLISFADVFATHSILIAPTEYSATAPLKVAAKKFNFRAATMSGFCEAMIPALRVDYSEVNRRVGLLKDKLDAATGADFCFRHAGSESSLHLDLRFRRAHASGGLLPNPGFAGNLPSGEAYIVPFEGESEASLSAGELPVQFGDEVVRYRIERNKAVAVLTSGEASRREAEHLAREPAYGNIAELGLGVLAAFGVKPVGEILLDEKLGVHIAFGRSEHFGGQVGPGDFSSPDAVIHIDRVYVPETQPAVTIKVLDLVMPGGERLAVIRDGDYVVDFG